MLRAGLLFTQKKERRILGSDILEAAGVTSVCQARNRRWLRMLRSLALQGLSRKILRLRYKLSIELLDQRLTGRLRFS